MWMSDTPWRRASRIMVLISRTSELSLCSIGVSSSRMSCECCCSRLASSLLVLSEVSMSDAPKAEGTISASVSMSSLPRRP